VKLSGTQTIGGAKTFSTSPSVPNKTSAAENSGTAIATEAQVYAAAKSAVTLSNFTSGSGWRRLPDGFVIQWGGLVLTSNPQAITFPVAFTSLYTILTGQASAIVTYTENGNLTGFNAFGSAGLYFRYIAIGAIT
jgi:hypothetical protein